MAIYAQWKICAICRNRFEAKNARKNVCSWECKLLKIRERSRLNKRNKERRKNMDCEPCVICGWKLSTDTHHEGLDTHILCPNHHALITRNLVTYQQMKDNPEKY